uniref:DNA primase large subunit (Trinotate prediction) n=1 Tax=Myxobolus squamalis TaxID=59785 RepID=A0A6B2FXR4_MYXSQ
MYNITRDYNENLKTKHDGDQFPKFDEISHFLLRLAFCKQSNQRQWFVSLEADLLRFKLKNFPTTNMETLLKHSNLNYQKMENNKKNNGDKPESYYKIRFEDVLDLVRSRKVYLESGFAHVSVDLLIPLIVEFFKNNLYKECEKLVSNIHRIEEDDRLLLRLSNIMLIRFLLSMI